MLSPNTDTIAMLCIGDELLDGRAQDAHTNYAGGALRKLGRGITEAAIVADAHPAIRDTLLRLCTTHRAVIVTGGLGPTVDDVTRDAIAEACGEPLVVREDVRERLKQKYTKRGRRLENVNQRQALFPPSATIYESRWGIADAFMVQVGEAKVFVLPGPRREFRPLFDTYVLPQFSPLTSLVSTFTVGGIGEGQLTKQLDGLIPKDVTIRYCAKSHYVEIDLSGSDQRVVTETTKHVKDRLRHWIVPSDPAATLVQRLTTEEKTLSVAESCTGGAIASWITDVPGASAVFNVSFVTYADQAKTTHLGVPTELLTTYGAVSREVATAMVTGARRAATADLAIAVTGIAGPSGGSDEKPVGTVYIGLATADQTVVIHALFRGRSRAQFKQRVSALGLVGALRLLDGQTELLSSHFAVTQVWSTPTGTPTTQSE